MSELNDKDLIEQAVTDAPIEAKVAHEKTEAEAAVETQSAETETPRNEMGQFAPKAKKEEARTEAQPTVVQPPAQSTQNPQPPEGFVPSWRLREIRERAEAAERRLAEFERNSAQKPQEPVDWYADPNKAIQQSLSPYEQRMQQMEKQFAYRSSRAEAIAIHGRAALDEAEQVIERESNSGNPEIRLLALQMQNSDDPVGLAIRWHQNHKLLKETGGDLSAYKTKTLDDALKDPAFLAKAIEAAKSHASGQPAKANTVVQLPPSLNRATSAASPHEEQGDLTDKSLYAHAIR